MPSAKTAPQNGSEDSWLFEAVELIAGAEGLSEENTQLVQWAVLLKADRPQAIPTLDEKQSARLEQLKKALQPGFQATNKRERVLRDAVAVLRLENTIKESQRLIEAASSEPRREGAHAETIAALRRLRDEVSLISFMSDAAKEVYEAKRLEFRRQLRDVIREQSDGGPSASGLIHTRAAQVMLRTALRNHIDLTSIADSKANIMLSNNALIATLGAPWLLQATQLDPRLILPSCLLLATTISSALIATLVTRPVPLGPGHPPSGRRLTNPFFFGNFYSLSLPAYETELNDLMRDNQRLEHAGVVDMYFLGKALGSKYIRLRWCYNVFIAGMAAALLSLAVVLISPA